MLCHTQKAISIVHFFTILRVDMSLHNTQYDCILYTVFQILDKFELNRMAEATKKRGFHPRYTCSVPFLFHFTCS